MDRISVEPEFWEKLRQQFEEKGIVDEVLDAFIEVAAEFGIELEKEDLKMDRRAIPDVKDMGGAVVAYSNYVIIS